MFTAFSLESCIVAVSPFSKNNPQRAACTHGKGYFGRPKLLLPYVRRLYYAGRQGLTGLYRQFHDPVTVVRLNV